MDTKKYRKSELSTFDLVSKIKFLNVKKQTKKRRVKSYAVTASIPHLTIQILYYYITYSLHSLNQDIKQIESHNLLQLTTYLWPELHLSRNIEIDPPVALKQTVPLTSGTERV